MVIFYYGKFSVKDIAHSHLAVFFASLFMNLEYTQWHRGIHSHYPCPNPPRSFRPREPRRRIAGRRPFVWPRRSAPAVHPVPS